MAGQWKVQLENIVDKCSYNNKLVILSPFCHFRICYNVRCQKIYQQVAALFNKYISDLKTSDCECKYSHVCQIIGL